MDGEAARTLAASGRTVVCGYFDPLTAAHAERLNELARGGRLLVLVDDPPDPLMPAGARLELVAALDMVEAAAGLSEVGQLPPHAVDERAADLARRGALMAHIRARQALAQPE